VPKLPPPLQPLRRCSRSIRAVVVCAALGIAASASARDEKVVAPGDTLAGSLIQSADTSRLNANGQVAFQAQTPTERVVLIGRPDGGFFETARTGTALPEGGTLGALSSELSIADDGNVALRAGIDVGVPQLVNAALRAGVAGGLVELYRSGEPAPGGTAFGPSEVQMMTAGTVIFRSSFGTSGVSDGFGIFRTRPDLSALEALVLEGQLHDHDGVFGNVGHVIGRAGGNGVTFDAYATFDALPAQIQSLWRTNSPSAAPILLARAGQLVAGGTLASIDTASAETTRIDGTTAFAGVLSFASTGDRDALLVSGGFGQDPSLFNKEGDVEPTYGETYADFTPIPQADAYQFVAFHANLQSGRECLFREGAEIAGRALCLARTGDEPPGERPEDDYRYVALGSAGAGGLQLLAFDADVQRIDRIDPGPVLRGLYLLDPKEAYRITREGLAIGAKTVADVAFTEVNQHGQVLYRVEYADATSEQRLYTPTLHWRAPGDGTWHEVEKWTLHVFPARVHDVRVDPDVDVTVQGPSSITGARMRTLEVGGGAGDVTLNLFAGALLRVDAAPLAVHANGRITAGQAVLQGGLVSHGVVELGTQPNSYLQMIEGDVVNHGVVQGSGYLDAAVFTNEAGGLLSVGSGAGGTLTADVDAFANAAGANVAIAAGATAVFGGTFVNDGTVDVAAGGTATFEGVVSGNGNFTGAGEKQFLGGIAPGTSPGALAVAGPAVLGPDAVVTLEIAGTGDGEYDRLAFGGGITIEGGTLEIRFADGFEPAAGDVFAFLDWTTRDGEFGHVVLPELPPGIVWDVEQLYAEGAIEVPEPAGAAFAAACVLGMLRLGRRRSLR
jgi:hypothetical protein